MHLKVTQLLKMTPIVVKKLAWFYQPLNNFCVFDQNDRNIQLLSHAD